MKNEFSKCIEQGYVSVEVATGGSPHRDKVAEAVRFMCDQSLESSILDGVGF